MKIIATALACLMFSVFGNPAMAGIPYGTAGKIEYAGPTTLVDQKGANLSLCVLSYQKHVAWIGYWLSQEYVLSVASCEDDSYYEYSPEEFATDRADGFIDADVPDNPPFGLAQLIRGFLLWPIGLALIIFGVITSRKESAAMKKRDAILGDITPFQKRMVVVMCHAARAGAPIVVNDINAFQQMFNQEVGTELSIEEIGKVLELTPVIKLKAQFTALRKGMSEPEREKLFQVAIKMMSTDGILEKSGQAVIKQLGKGLGVSRKLIKESIANASAV